MLGRRQLALAIALLGLARLATSADPPAQGQFKKIESRHFANGIWVTDKVISGGVPEGDDAFRELNQLGVKTIICVDGARPDLAAAKKHDLAYVHLPFGYNGIPADRILELAKAVRDLPGPIYIHCHHGKNRSPAAAAVACVTVGTLDEAAAPGVLKAAGTGPSYRGLFQAVESARPIDPAVLDRLKVEFKTTVEVRPLAEAMVAISDVHEQLGKLAAAEWIVPADHPDLEPAHEAKLLHEQFVALLGSDEIKQQPQAFHDLLRDGAAAAGELVRGLQQKQDQKQLGIALERVSNNCKACHQKYRDVPLNAQ